MLELTLAHARANAGRFGASAGAVVIAVAFIVATSALTASSQRSVLDTVAAQYATTAAVVTAPDMADPAALPRAAALLGDLPGQAALATDSGTYVGLRIPGRAGSQLTPARSIAAVGPLRWQQLASGRMPTVVGEVAVSQRTGAAVGDVLTATPQLRGDIGPGTATPRPQQVTVVGVVDLGADPRANVRGQVFVVPAQVMAWGADGPGALRLAAARGVSDDVLIKRVRVALAADPATSGLDVATGRASALAVADAYTAGTSGLSQALLVFAAVALLVAGLVIANTFAVVLAQRTQELALLRCVGATSRQVWRGVVAEAAIVGFVASVVGAGVGAGLAALASVVLGGVHPSVPLGAVVLPPSAVVLGVAAGTALTVCSALLPARAATRVAPLAALRPLAPVATGARGGVLRLWVGLMLLIPSLPAMLALAAAGQLLPAVAAGAVSFLAVLLLAQRAVPPVVGLVGQGLARLGGLPAALAAANTVRNPRRTAATATALVIGMTLTAAVVVGAASTRASASALLDAGYPVDVVVSGQALSAPLAERLAGVEEVTATAPVLSATVAVGGREFQAAGVDVASAADVVRSTASQPLPAPGQVVVSASVADVLGVSDGDALQIGGATGTVELTAQVADGADAQLLLGATDLVAVDSAAPVGLVWVRLDDGLDGAAAIQVVDRVTQVAGEVDPASEVSARAAERAGLDGVVDVLLRVVMSLLAVAVLIALLGVGSTLALSVVERRQESGLVRALGLTRRQLGTTLVWEAVMVAGVSAALGCGLGVVYGIAGTQAVIGGSRPVHVVVPWLTLVMIVVVGALAGALASVLPARRAARIPPVAALAA